MLAVCFRHEQSRQAATAIIRECRIRLRRLRRGENGPVEKQYRHEGPGSNTATTWRPTASGAKTVCRSDARYPFLKREPPQHGYPAVPHHPAGGRDELACSRPHVKRRRTNMARSGKGSFALSSLRRVYVVPSTRWHGRCGTLTRQIRCKVSSNPPGSLEALRHVPVS